MSTKLGLRCASAAAAVVALVLASVSAGAQGTRQAAAESRIAPISERVPDVWRILQALQAASTSGEITSTDALIARARTLYVPEVMDRIEAVIPGWKRMSSYDGGKTLWHVNVAMLALLQLDEYRAMPADEQVVQQWIVLLHDLAKEPEHGRDHRHSFRSAAAVARILPSLGFPVSARYAGAIDAWFGLTDTAVVMNEAKKLPMQDNTKLPAIIGGIEDLFPEPARSAVAAIALHQSITSLAAWPVMAPMSREQVRQNVYPELVPPLAALTLADSGGWNLFDPPTLAAMYAETREVFRDLPRAGRAR